MKISTSNFFTTSDGVHIYFEDRGKGLPIVMVPGFLCTTRFFEKNAEVLSKEFRVITLDLRGQGNSSKCSGGNTVRRNAQDIRGLIDYLQLEHVVLLGWSLASSIVVSYAVEFKQHKLNGLVTMDGSLYPFSGEDWNHHRGKGYNLQNWFDTYLPLINDPNAFYEKFTQRIACAGGMDEQTKRWIMEECKKTPPWSALELHYDFCLTDNVSRLKQITVPYAVFGAQSEAYGLDMVEKFAGEVQGYSEVNKFYESGHLMFWYEAEKFNRCLAAFVKKAEQIRLEEERTGEKQRA